MAGLSYSHWIDHVFCCTLRHIVHNPKRILADYVKPGMMVLDVGFGNGYFSLGMARMVGAKGLVVAVETAQEKVESLKLQVAKGGLEKRVIPRICSDSSLEIDDLEGQIDFSLAFFVVHHVADVPALMSGTHRALKLGGKFLIVEPSHHVSTSYCISVESAAEQAGLSVIDHPKFIRTWAVLLAKR
ncbi:MAG: methyltransferase domain-containing protein [candidate division Zixibacteria bacterium]|nr:methyltransferase domain-containing protein [candidate division Zixibacteria bacterium]MDD5426808.1 methyltransferase domain-containing protein [candidate division Zixibacteria bacterium]